MFAGAMLALVHAQEDDQGLLEKSDTLLRRDVCILLCDPVLQRKLGRPYPLRVQILVRRHVPKNREISFHGKRSSSARPVDAGSDVGWLVQFHERIEIFA